MSNETKGKGFVKKPLCRASPGFMGGGDEREQSGRRTPGSGPGALIMSKGLFEFHQETREMHLDALFPVLTSDDVRADVPRDLQAAGEIQSFPAPHDEEIDFLRRFLRPARFPIKRPRNYPRSTSRRAMAETLK